MTHIATVLRILSERLATTAFRQFVEKLKKLLLSGHPHRTASDETLENVQFLKEMHDKKKPPDVVAVMLAQKELGHASVDHKNFFEETFRRVYRETIKQMYDYFDSPEASSDPLDWREVFNNIFQAVVDERAEDFSRLSAEDYGLDEVPEDVFWNAAKAEIEELTKA